MSCLTLEVEVLAGTSIYKAFDDALALCKKLDLAYVNFKFNGISISIGQNTTDKGFESMYEDFYKSGNKYIVCNS